MSRDFLTNDTKLRPQLKKKTSVPFWQIHLTGYTYPESSISLSTPNLIGSYKIKVIDVKWNQKQRAYYNMIKNRLVDLIFLGFCFPVTKE